MPASKPEKKSQIMTLHPFSAATALALVVIFSTLVMLTEVIAGDRSPVPPGFVAWVLLIAGVELLQVPNWAGVRVSLGYPLLIAVAIYVAPPWAALAALLGSSDPRELRGEVTPLQALFNRCQVALAILAASSVFHSLSSVHNPLVQIIPAALVATTVDYAINVGLVTIAVSLVYKVSPVRAVGQLIGRGKEFLVSYLGFGTLGGILAKLYSVPGIGLWSVLTVLAPLLLARQVFLRSQALEEAHRELQEREQVLKSLSNAMAEERQDERTQIAGYLHDDLAQILFRLSIQVDVAKRLLEKGEIDETLDQLDKIRQSKQDTSDRIRALIRDLHRSPIGPKGLVEALESFTDEMGRDSGVSFHTDVEEIALPAPIALLVYHIAREGVMNALKHAKASDFWITVREDGDSIELCLRDDGVGFDLQAPGPEGHYGMAMMRERAQVGGGRFTVESAPGEGTTITVHFPKALLLPPQSAPGRDEGGEAHASPDTPGTTGPAAEHSRESVRA